MAEQKRKTTKMKVTKSSGMSIPVYDLQGTKKKSASLPKEMFSETASPKLLAQYVRVYLPNQRQGTATTKTRTEVEASTRKIYRQKGTGRARHGAISAPIFVGGGIVGGPKPRDFSLKINKKQRKKAFFAALSLALKEGEIMGLVNESLKTEPKTKKIAKFLKKLDLKSKKVVIVLPKLEANGLVLASRNIPKVEVRDAKSLNAYDVLNAGKIIFVEDALKVMSEHFLKS